MPQPHQYDSVVWRTTLRAHTRRGSHTGWYLVNSALPLTTWLPPSTTMRDQLKVWLPCSADVVVGNTAPLASIDCPVMMVPLWIAVARSLRTDLASATAPSMLSRA